MNLKKLITMILLLGGGFSIASVGIGILAHQVLLEIINAVFLWVAIACIGILFYAYERL